MAITHTPQNPQRNTTPAHMSTSNYSDPFEVKALVESYGGLPKQSFDRIETDIKDIVEDSWLGFLDYYNLNFNNEEQKIRLMHDVIYTSVTYSNIIHSQV